MKSTKLLSGIFAVLGAALAVGTVALCLNCLDASPVLLTPPEAALEKTEALMCAITDGDYAAVGSMLYGQPDLGMDRDPSDEAGILIWDAFADSISYEFAGGCYAADSGVARDVTITALDISSVTAPLKERSQTLLAQRVAAAEDVTEIYDENNDYREDFVMDVLYDAVAQALEEDAEQTQWDVTLNLVYQDGQWWIVADEALLEAISGGVAG